MQHASTNLSRANRHAPYHRHVNRVLLALLFLLPAAVACGDIEVKPQYDANESITVKVVATGIPEGALLRGSFQIPTATWELVAVPNGKELRAVATNLRSQAEKIDAAVQPDAKKAMIDAAQEIERTVGSEAYHVWATVGTHTITASGIWVLTDTGTLGGKLLDFGVYQYTKSFVVGEGDEVVPPPDPLPPGTRRAVILEETEQRTPAQSVLFQSLTLAKKAEVLDDDQPSAQKYLPMLPSSLTSVRPVLLVIAEGDKLVRAVPCPSSTAGVEQEVSR